MTNQPKNRRTAMTKEVHYKLSVELISPLLGSQPSKDVASEYLAKKAGFDSLPEAELETLPDALDKGTTVFHKDAAGNPILWAYQVKGFLKNGGQVFNGRVTGGIKNLRKKVGDYVFVTPPQIKLLNGKGAPDITYNERPLRAQTPQGERVALARSEQIDAGAHFSCGITVIEDVIGESVLRELLDYGYYQGLGQWRGGGYGQFTYKLEREEDE